MVNILFVDVAAFIRYSLCFCYTS